MRRLFATTLLFTTTFGPLARAQEAPPYTPTFDMQLPAASVASCPGPLSLGYNPAGLAFAPSLDLLYLHGELLDPDRVGEKPLKGHADGLLMNFRWFGLGLQWLRPDSDQEKLDYLKYTLVVPSRHGQWFSLGYGLEILDPLNTSEDAAVDFMLGAQARPLRYLSLGLVGRNLGRAKISGVRAFRTVDLGVAVRPLWFAPERLTLATDFRLVAGAPDPSIRFTGQISIIDGISLLGTADLGGNFGAGLVVDFSRLGVGSYLSFKNASGVEADAVVAMARLSSESQPGFRLTGERTAEFKLDRELSTDQPSTSAWFRRRPTLYQVVESIEQATRDDGVDSVLIKVEDPQLQWADVQELRQALASFKQTGKKVFFHLQLVDNLSYYLASIGDAIYLAPGSSLQLTGPKVEALFLRGTLDLLGVRPEPARVGKYKSAVEQLSNRKPSEPYREVMNSLADELADQMFSAVAEGRRKSREQVTALVNQGVMPPEEAQTAGLIDGTVHYDEMDQALEKHLGHSPRRIPSYLFERRYRDRWGSAPTIAVVHAKGAISYGGTLGGGLDGREMAQLLSRLADDRQVDAVILRVDSPGGSGMASELIWREAVRLKQRKPLIVSMANTAASGGYYISCPADLIVANPATITGSIGAFILLFDLSKLYAKVGIDHQVVKRGELSDLNSTFRGRTPQEMALIEKNLSSFYQGFVERVAEGRKMKPERVDEIGQGRVWTGRQAVEKGLVNELGGLQTAMAFAREKIGIRPEDPVRIIHLPHPRFSLGALFKELDLISEETAPLPLLVSEAIEKLLLLGTLGSESVLAILPFWLTLR